MTRGLKNNNPGNIRKGGAVFIGEVASTDTAFKQFESMEYGYRAMIKTIQTYISKYSADTIEKIISRWAPPSENNTTAYISTVSKRSGIASTTKINSGDLISLGKIIGAMSFVENGVDADVSKIQAALNLLGVTGVIADQVKKNSGKASLILLLLLMGGGLLYSNVAEKKKNIERPVDAIAH